MKVLVTCAGLRLLALAAMAGCVDLSLPRQLAGPVVQPHDGSGPADASLVNGPADASVERAERDAATIEADLPPAPSVDGPRGQDLPPDAPLATDSVAPRPVDAPPAAPDAAAERPASPSGTVAHFPFDEGRGTMSADLSGRGHVASLLNGVVWSTERPPSSMPGSFSLKLDGADDHVRVSRTPALEPPTVAVSLWVRREGSQAMWAPLFQKDWRNDLGPVYGSYLLQAAPDGRQDVVEFGTGHPGSYDGLRSTPGALPDGVWVRLVVVYDPAGPAPQKRLYVNGVLDVSRNLNLPLSYDSTSTGDLLVGRNGGSTGPFRGWIDDLRISDRAPTSAELSALR